MNWKDIKGLIREELSEEKLKNLKKGDIVKFKNGKRLYIVGPKGDGYDYKDGREKGHHTKGWFDMMISTGKAIVESINEETNVTADNTTFIMRTGVNKNPTKLGLKIQFTPKSGALDRDTKSRLAQILQSKLNDSLRKFNLQASIDTDVPNPEVIGFLIPLMQVKNMIVKAIGGSEETPEVEDGF